MQDWSVLEILGRAWCPRMVSGGCLCGAAVCLRVGGLPGPSFSWIQDPIPIPDSTAGLLKCREGQPLAAAHTACQEQREQVSTSNQGSSTWVPAQNFLKYSQWTPTGRQSLSMPFSLQDFLDCLNMPVTEACDLLQTEVGHLLGLKMANREEASTFSWAHRLCLDLGLFPKQLIYYFPVHIEHPQMWAQEIPILTHFTDEDGEAQTEWLTQVPWSR